MIPLLYALWHTRPWLHPSDPAPPMHRPAGILNVAAVDKGSGKSEKITITNDKGEWAGCRLGVTWWWLGAGWVLDGCCRRGILG